MEGPFRVEGTWNMRVVYDTATGLTTRYEWDPPLEFKVETWVMFAPDGSIALYDAGGVFIRSVLPSKVEVVDASA